MTKRKNLIAEHYECSKGSLFANTYKWVQYSLTLKPDIIEVFRVTRKETIPETTFKTLDEFITWYTELKNTYKQRVTRQGLHYINHNGQEFIYTDYPSNKHRGLHMVDGLMRIPQMIMAPNQTYYLDVNSDAIQVNGSEQHTFTNPEDYQTWYKKLLYNSIIKGKVTRRYIRCYIYTQDHGFQRVTDLT